jgi:hypothetical protein
MSGKMNKRSMVRCNESSSWRNRSAVQRPFFVTRCDLTSCPFRCCLGHVEKIDWVIHSALTAFAGAEETGEIDKEDSSEEEYDEEEEG